MHGKLSVPALDGGATEKVSRKIVDAKILEKGSVALSLQ